MRKVIAVVGVLALVVASILYLSYSSFDASGSKVVATTSTAINGQSFYVDDVSSDSVVNNPGYSYFINGSVTFRGVVFASFCPSGYIDCPGAKSNSSATTVFLSLVKVYVTFPDHTMETMSKVIGDLPSITALSKHSGPQAGIIVDQQTQRVYLLVSMN